MKAKIRQFVLNNFLFTGSHEDLDNDASFLDNGIMDSTGVLELVEFLENEFQISVEDTDLIRENLDSVNRVCLYLEKKGAAACRA